MYPETRIDPFVGSADQVLISFASRCWACLYRMLVGTVSAAGRVCISCWSGLSAAGHVYIGCWSCLYRLLVVFLSGVGRDCVGHWSCLYRLLVVFVSGVGRDCVGRSSWFYRVSVGCSSYFYLCM